MRRVARPAPTSPRPTSAARPALKPVIGSDFELLVGDAAGVAVAVALLVLEDDVDDVLELGNVGESDPDEGVAVVPDVVGVVLCEPLVEVFLPPPLFPARGSVYWLSPAEGPPARAAAGTIMTSTARISSELSVTRQKRTRRVLQGPRPAVSAARLPHTRRTGTQTCVLQDLLQHQEDRPRSRRLVLGCSAPRRDSAAANASASPPCR